MFPQTLSSDKIRRIGLSDGYLISASAGSITVSLDKRGGVYDCGVVWTADPNPTHESTWTYVTPFSDAIDVVDQAIDPTATAVAVVLHSTTDTEAPAEGALFTVKDANTANNFSKNQRKRWHTGSFDLSKVEYPAADSLLATAFLGFDANQLGTLWLDTIRTDPALGVQDEFIHAWDNVGTDDFVALTERVADDHGFYWTGANGINGRPGVAGVTLGGGTGGLSDMDGVVGEAYTGPVSVWTVAKFAPSMLSESNFGVYTNWADSNVDGLICQCGPNGSLTARNASSADLIQNRDDIVLPFWDGFMLNMWKADGTIEMVWSEAAERAVNSTAKTFDVSNTAEISVLDMQSGNSSGQTMVCETYWFTKELTAYDEGLLIQRGKDIFGITPVT